MPDIIKFVKKGAIPNERQLRTGFWTTSEECLDDFYDYLTYIEENVPKEHKLYGSEGSIAQLDKMRMPTLQGFGYYLRATQETLRSYSVLDENWAQVFSFIESTMHAITIEGAAAGLIKETVAMRKLNLVDRKEVNYSQKRVVILHTPDNGRAQIVGQENEPKYLLHRPDLIEEEQE